MARRLSQMADEQVKAGGRAAWLKQRAEDRRIRLSQILGPPGAGGPMAGAAPMTGGPGPAGAPPPLSRETVEAAQNIERTPEVLAAMAQAVEEGEEHLARGRYPEAKAAYMRVMPVMPENGRAKAGLAWALVGQGSPMAANVWTVAVRSDAAAVEALGDTLKAKGDAQGARALWAKLKDSAPDYPQRASLEAKLGQ